MHFPRLSKPTPLPSMKHGSFVDTPISPVSDKSASSGESLQFLPHRSPDVPDLAQNQLFPPAWVSSMRALLRDRSSPANKLQEQHTSAAPITSEKMHRDLVEWSARVGSIERELRALLRELMGEGVDLAGALVAIQEEEDVLVVERLWSR
jgi:hypothetical protein